MDLRAAMPAAALEGRSRARRRFLAALAALAAGAATAAPVSTDTLTLPAALVPRALGALMLDVTLAGRRLVAVGERGIVLCSDDAGAQWRQMPCPVSVTLTAVEFATPSLGWAVGHGGVVLHSRDGGSNWIVQLDGRRAAVIEQQAAESSGDALRRRRATQAVADGADKPLLALHVDAAGRRVVVVGAYGIAYASTDAGTTWSSWRGRLDNPKGLHLNALYVVERRLYLGGEAGLLLRSDDGGESFKRLASPYEGSWFALTGVGDELLVAAGLRGNLWWSENRGASFQRAEVPVPVSFTSAVRPVAGVPLMLVNQAGMVLVSDDRARHWHPLALPPGPPMTRVARAADGGFVGTSFAGMVRLPTIGPRPQSATPPSR